MSSDTVDDRATGVPENPSRALDFPDLPQLELEALIGQLQARAQDVLGAQGRLRGLLAANAAVASDLSLRVLLRRIVDAARDLVGARYAALGVIGRDGDLEEFVHAGMASDAETTVGRLPRGGGILGLLTTHPTPIRLADLAEHPASTGFPAHHPPMRSFLGVPIRVRDVVFGNLYLTERIAGGEFTAEDEELVVALAATAGVAIENARLFDESEQRRRWLAASGDVTRELLSVGESETAAVLVASVLRAADADLAYLARPLDDDRVVVMAALGDAAADLDGRVLPAAGSLPGEVCRTGKSLLERGGGAGGARGAGQPDVPVRPGLGPAVGVPLVVDDEILGALCVSRRRDRPQYTDGDVDLITGFGNQAALALELGRAREAHQELRRLADRDRIGRDLHDHVIQELYALGMGLQAMIPAAAGAEQAARLDGYVDAVDATIRRIRTTIFELTPPGGVAGLQSRLLEVVAQETAVLGFRPSITFRGPLDVMVDGAFAGDVVAVVREALSNCARHAGATRVSVAASLDGDLVTVVVTDDGRGFDARPDRASGWANLRHRAEARSGRLAVVGVPGGGCTLTWTARATPAG